ncbi:MAG: tRNA (N(6)-L-threonylcarbamoyladenosine(37)-C(2))-methylthiotransferase MtaB [Saccharofermentans sp.]|nr:tRNA (N(6)-L-threonylcarbamoyladenosine(37)-C(2))-methylthiotransferase MtaB [Saccharofermentans sp.]
MKVYFLTLGCRVNQYETDAVRRLFIDNGHIITEDASEADVCIVNTCTVTGEADRKSGQMLRRMARTSPDAVIVAMGCSCEMAQGKVDADIIVGTRDKNKVLDIVTEYMEANKGRKAEHLTSHTRPEVTKKDDYHDFGSVLSPEGTRAFVKIEDGCNNFCSYCIIPFARGRVASRPEESCISEARFLAGEGYKEIVVSGIHLCSYGKDRGEDIMSLYNVLHEIDSVEGLARLRLGSLEPMSMTEEFIESVASLKHICPHFHLSLQSGSDTVLRRMNRRYDTRQYMSRVELLRKHFPDMSLTTDIITGFPGETREEFEQTLAFAKTAAFAKIHVFPYSVREGTAAARMEQVPVNVRKERAQELISLSDKLSYDFAAGQVGSKASVLVERSISGVSEGYTANYVKCFIDGVYEVGSILSGVIDSSSKGTVHLSV